MEKFGKWRDGFTGIHPFLPVTRRSHSCWALLAGIPLVLVRVLCLVALAPMVLVRCALVWLVCSIPRLGRIITRILDRLLFGLLLFVLGYPWKSLIGPSLGQCCVARLTSYLDLFVLVYLHSPTFAFPDSNGKWQTMGLLTSLLHLVRPHSARLNGSVTDERTLKCTGPLVLFPEAVASNGLAVLRFSGSVQSNAPLSLVSIHHDAAFPVGSFVSHLLALLLRPYAVLTVRTATVRLDASVDCFFQNQLAKLAGLRTIQVGATEKAEFMSFWRKHA